MSRFCSFFELCLSLFNLCPITKLKNFPSETKELKALRSRQSETWVSIENETETKPKMSRLRSSHKRKIETVEFFFFQNYNIFTNFPRKERSKLVRRNFAFVWVRFHPFMFENNSSSNELVVSPVCFLQQSFPFISRPHRRRNTQTDVQTNKQRNKQIVWRLHLFVCFGIPSLQRNELQLYK
jgi:hypothetical protein